MNTRRDLIELLHHINDVIQKYSTELQGLEAEKDNPMQRYDCQTVGEYVSKQIPSVKRILKKWRRWKRAVQEVMP